VDILSDDQILKLGEFAVNNLAEHAHYFYFAAKQTFLLFCSEIFGWTFAPIRKP